MIKLNNLSVSEDYRGNLQLGRVQGFYVSGETGAQYTLYGTLFKKEHKTTVTVPSGNHVFLKDESIEPSLLKQLKQRQDLVAELQRLRELRANVENKVYDYGVSKRLTEMLAYLSENTIRQLPSILIGGELDYDLLLKAGDSTEDFESEWETWSHVEPGRKKYDNEELPETKMLESTGFLVGAAEHEGLTSFDKGVALGMPTGFTLQYFRDPVHEDKKRIIDDDIKVVIGGVTVLDKRRNQNVREVNGVWYEGTCITEHTRLEFDFDPSTEELTISQNDIRPGKTGGEFTEVFPGTVPWAPGVEVQIFSYDGWAYLHWDARWEVTFRWAQHANLEAPAPIQGGSAAVAQVSLDVNGDPWRWPPGDPHYSWETGGYWTDSGLAASNDHKFPGLRPIDCYYPNGSFILG